jgi:hypothetical protein
LRVTLFRHGEVTVVRHQGEADEVTKEGRGAASELGRAEG